MLKLTFIVTIFLAQNLFGISKNDFKDKLNKFNEKSSYEFEIEYSDYLFESVNDYLTDDNFLKATKMSLKRGRKFEQKIKSTFLKYNVPEEFWVIPVIESSFKNFKKGHKRSVAGLFMFDVPSARAYGLKVNKKVDERLNIDKEITAAARMIARNRKFLEDSFLALQAFNQGPLKVKNIMKKCNSNDVFDLIENCNLKDYSLKILSVILYDI